MFDQVEIPYGCYWSTPFVRWQEAFQHLHAVKFVVNDIIFARESGAGGSA
jgi:hypothetical protein